MAAALRKSGPAVNEYLGEVPWLFARAHTVAGAKECVRQVIARPLEDHDPVTRDFITCVGNDLKERAEGAELTQALEYEADCVNLRNLNEGSGDGFHRETNLEKRRAPASSTIHMKQTVHLKKVMRAVRGFIHLGGERAKRVFRLVEALPTGIADLVQIPMEGQADAPPRRHEAGLPRRHDG